MSKKELSIKIIGLVATAIGLTFMLIAVCVIDASVFVIEFVVKYLRERNLAERSIGSIAFTSFLRRKEMETTTGESVRFKLPAFLFGRSTHFMHSPWVFNHPLAFVYGKFPKLEDFIKSVTRGKLYQLDT